MKLLHHSLLLILFLSSNVFASSNCEDFSGQYLFPGLFNEEICQNNSNNSEINSNLPFANYLFSEGIPWMGVFTINQFDCKSLYISYKDSNEIEQEKKINQITFRKKSKKVMLIKSSHIKIASKKETPKGFWYEGRNQKSRITKRDNGDLYIESKFSELNLMFLTAPILLRGRFRCLLKKIN